MSHRRFEMAPPSGSLPHYANLLRKRGESNFSAATYVIDTVWHMPSKLNWFQNALPIASQGTSAYIINTSICNTSSFMEVCWISRKFDIAVYMAVTSVIPMTLYVYYIDWQLK